MVSLSGTSTQYQTLAANVTDVDGLLPRDSHHLPVAAEQRRRRYVERHSRCDHSRSDAAAVPRWKAGSGNRWLHGCLGQQRVGTSNITAAVGNVNDVGLASIHRRPRSGPDAGGVTLAIRTAWQMLRSHTNGSRAQRNQLEQYLWRHRFKRTFHGGTGRQTSPPPGYLHRSGGRNRKQPNEPGHTADRREQSCRKRHRRRFPQRDANSKSDPCGERYRCRRYHTWSCDQLSVAAEQRWWKHLEQYCRRHCKHAELAASTSREAGSSDATYTDALGNNEAVTSSSDHGDRQCERRWRVDDHRRTSSRPGSDRRCHGSRWARQCIDHISLAAADWNDLDQYCRSHGSKLDASAGAGGQAGPCEGHLHRSAGWR